MKKTDKTKLTPLMKQYYDIREKYSDALLLFQVGDFYELFFDDAKKAAAFLGITLTKRGKENGEPIPLCGVPVHALNHYLTKLVKGGFKVAICNQLSQATPGKVVERGVTQVLTPGTLTDSTLLDEKSASYLFSFFPSDNGWGLLFGELLTAQLFATVLPVNSQKMLESELVRFFPDEILLPQNKLGKSFQSVFKRLGYFTSFGGFEFQDENNVKKVDDWVKNQFRKDCLSQISKHESLMFSLYNFYWYVKRNQRDALEHFRSLHFYDPDDFLILDPSTQKNLELVKNNQDGSRRNSLFALMDKAATSMGSRMVKKWIVRPLIKKETIEQRQDVVQLFSENVSLNQKLYELLVQIGDIERIVGRIALSRAIVSDYISLTNALGLVPEVGQLISSYENVVLMKVINSYFGDFSSLVSLLKASINDDSSRDWLIKEGFDKNLDSFRDLVLHSNERILELEKKERAATGINSLKIRFNKVHGYYIEVTKSNLHLVPSTYIRQQTLVGRERFTYRELRDLQDQIVRANSEADRAEKELFDHIKNEVYQFIVPLRKLAHAAAHLDALLSFANVASDYGYVRPVFSNNCDIIIKGGRHPVIEAAESINFIPNDTVLTDGQSLLIVTGPNMGGKSTFLRQVALICIMAQCGSFVPAESANLALLDRVFTRIGSGDNLAGGKSTFLVEMEETALICNQATEKSLVILDEVGRGTSTFDGLAIAQSVVEYIYSKKRSRCLFATHYHDLTDLKHTFSGIQSYYAASKRTDQGIIFLYKMIKGVADGSFGLEVAKLADLPASLIFRAADILSDLEGKSGLSKQMGSKGPGVADYGLYEQALCENKSLKSNISDMKNRIIEYKDKLAMLKDIDYDELSPKKAFDLLWRLKEG